MFERFKYRYEPRCQRDSSGIWSVQNGYQRSYGTFCPCVFSKNCLIYKNIFLSYSVTGSLCMSVYYE